MAWRVALAVLALQVSAVLADTEDVEGDLGSSVRLPCHFDRTKDVAAISVQWKLLLDGDEFQILYYHNRLKRKTDRVIWEGDLSAGEAGIKLIELKHDDEGSYTCEVIDMAENKQHKATFRLTIREPGSNVQQSDPPAVPANQRSEAEVSSGMNVATIIAVSSLCVILVIGSLVYAKWRTNKTRALAASYKAMNLGDHGQGRGPNAPCGDGGGRPLVTITVMDGSYGGSQVKQVSV
ncbi:uncharacterized protein LOC144953281 [Lampetra fluviatilis]